MLVSFRRSAPPVIVCLAVCSCAGRADKFGDTRQAPADTEPVAPVAETPDFDPARPDEVRFDDSVPYEESRVIATADSIDACSFHDAEDRVALHHRDARSSTCVDLILIRRSKGGVAPEGLGLPLDWGIGHMSSYPCTPDGQLKERSAPTSISDVKGNLGMGGGALGLPVALALDLTLSAPSADSAARVSYVFEASSLDVTRTCDGATPWARQPLNLQGEVSPSTLTGCTYSGGYDRVILHQQGPSAGVCSTFSLIYDEEGSPSEGLAVATNWSVEQMSSYGCSEDGVALPGGAEIQFTEVVGEVIFGGDPRRLPAYVWLDVTLSAPDESLSPSPCAFGTDCPPEAPPALPVAPQRLFDADAVDLATICGG